MSFWKRYRAAFAKDAAFARRELLTAEALSTYTLVAVFVLLVSAGVGAIIVAIKWAIS